MKRYLITVLVCLLPIIAQSQKVLLYEYTKDDCYYTLELDTLHKDGRFCAYNCYNAIYLIEIHLSINRIDDDSFVYTPYYYYYWDSILNWKFDFTVDDPFNVDGFFFWYDVKNNWQRLEYGYFHFYENADNKGYFSSLNKETMMLSPFFEQYGISWFPPYMESTKKINYNRFPEKLRKVIKKGRLK